MRENSGGNGGIPPKDIPVSWLIEWARKSGDVQKAKLVKEMIGDYVMETLYGDLASDLDGMVESCKKKTDARVVVNNIDTMVGKVEDGGVGVAYDKQSNNNEQITNKQSDREWKWTTT